MKRLLDESTVKGIYEMLVERFGEPIGKVKDIGPGVADERGGHPHKGEDPGNYGWGSSKLSEGAGVCPQCGGMMGLDEDVCTSCSMMSDMDESEGGGRHPGHDKACTCPDCSRPVLHDESELDEKAPPGREKQVKALKKEPGVDNPYAVAWASYNKKH